MRALKWLIGGVTVAWIVGGFVRRAVLSTRVLPFLPRPESPVAKDMFHVEPVERHDHLPSEPSSMERLEDQQHVDASYRQEHGHPKH